MGIYLTTEKHLKQPFEIPKDKKVSTINTITNKHGKLKSLNI